LKAKIEDSRLKLERANKLTSLLGNEKTRWRTDIQKFKDERQLIAGNSVLSAGMVAYAGPFTSDFRQDIEKDWQNYLTVLKLDHLVGVTMSKYLENPVDVQYWNIKGLPKDETSKENGIIIYQSNRWPLMIDP
jgi:dynein heavy chain